MKVAHEIGSREFLKPLTRLGIPARLAPLRFGDFAFVGHGPDDSLVRVGIERKTIDEMVGASSFARFKGHQLPGLLRTYRYCFLVVEGLTKADPTWGSFLSGKEVKDGRMVVWFQAGWGRNGATYERYKKQELTLRLKACLQVVPTANPHETALFLHALYGWFEKPWDSHGSAYQVNEAMPDHAILDERTLRRQVFAQLPGVGWKRSAKVSRYFHCIADAATATEEQWMRALGIKKGRAIAQTLVRTLHGEDQQVGKGS